MLGQDGASGDEVRHAGAPGYLFGLVADVLLISGIIFGLGMIPFVIGSPCSVREAADAVLQSVFGYAETLPHCAASASDAMTWGATMLFAALLVYFTWGFGSGQTLGCRFMGVHVVDRQTGRPPGYLKGLVHALVTCIHILIWAPCVFGITLDYIYQTQFSPTGRAEAGVSFLCLLVLPFGAAAAVLASPNKIARTSAVRRGASA